MKAVFMWLAMAQCVITCDITDITRDTHDVISGFVTLSLTKPCCMLKFMSSTTFLCYLIVYLPMNYLVELSNKQNSYAVGYMPQGCKLLKAHLIL